MSFLKNQYVDPSFDEVGDLEGCYLTLFKVFGLFGGPIRKWGAMKPFQNLVGESVYHEDNLPPVEVAAKTWRGLLPISPCPQAHMKISSKIGSALAEHSNVS